MIPSTWAPGGAYSNDGYDQIRADQNPYGSGNLNQSYRSMQSGSLQAMEVPQARIVPPEEIHRMPRGSESPAGNAFSPTGFGNSQRDLSVPSSRNNLGNAGPDLSAKFEEERALWSKSMEDYFAQKLRGIQEEIDKSREEALLMINHVASQCQDQFRQLSGVRMERGVEFDNLRSTVERMQSQVNDITLKPNHLRLSSGESIEDLLRIHSEKIDGLLGERTQKHLQVKISSASGLPEKDEAEGKSDTYCVATVLGKPHSKVQTQVAFNNSSPIWDYTGELADFAPGDSLEICVYDKDSKTNSSKKDQAMGTVVIPSKIFYPDGFYGDIEVSETGAMVHLEIIPAQEVAAPGAAGAAVAARAAVLAVQACQDDISVMKRQTAMIDQKLLKAEQIHSEAKREMQSRREQETSPKNREARQEEVIVVDRHPAEGQDLGSYESRLRFLESEVVNMQQFSREKKTGGGGGGGGGKADQLQTDTVALRQALEDTKEAFAQKLLKAMHFESKKRVDFAKEVEKKCKVKLNAAKENVTRADDETFWSSVGRTFGWAD